MAQRAIRGYGPFARAMAATALLAGMLSAQESYRKEISLSSETRMHAVVELGFGTLTLGRAPRGTAVELRYEGPPFGDEEIQFDYRIEGKEGELRIGLREESLWGGRSRSHDGEDRRWTLLLTDRIPLALDVEFGAGRGTIDLTGLRIEELKLSSGASSVDLECREVNPIAARRVSIESGVGKLSAEGLANLNFEVLRFSGGVGSYKLDFSGTLARSGEVDIDVGLGAVTVSVPRASPVQVRYARNWLSSFHLDGDFVKKRGDTYETDAFIHAPQKLKIRIESGLGSVSVRSR